MKISRFISVKSATAGAIFMGGMVYYVNYRYGWQAAGIAALKQAFYTFFFGGACVKISENIACTMKNKWAGVFWGTVIASIITTSAVYGIHNIKGTPEPFESTLPTAILAPFGFIFLSWYKREQEDKKKEKEIELEETILDY